MTNIDALILSALVLLIAIAVLAVLLWISDDRCEQWKMYAQRLEREAWNDKVDGDVIRFHHPEKP